MKKPVKQLCSFMSNSESDIYTGSHYCRFRCPHFNGTVNKKEISCLIPKI